MSATSHSAAAMPAPVRINAKQVLSLFGLLPLSAYVFLHLWTNMNSLQGPEAFDKALLASRGHPAFILFEIFSLGVPLLSHSILGMLEVARGRPNNASYPFFDNLKYILQRVSAVGLLLWIGAHIVKARLMPAIECTNAPACSETWMGMHEAFSEPVTLVVYALGMLAISYHLANGLYTASMRWGIVVSDAGRRRMTVVSVLVLATLMLMFSASVWGFKPFQPI